METKEILTDYLNSEILKLQQQIHLLNNDLKCATEQKEKLNILLKNINNDN